MPTTVTKTVKASGGDYSGIVAYEAGEQADLVSLDEIRQAECYAFLDYTGPAINNTFDGWTTDATRYIRVFAASGNQHTCAPETGYRVGLAAFGHGFTIVESFMRVEGVALQSINDVPSGGWGDRGFDVNMGSGDIRVSKCYQVMGHTFDNAFMRVFGTSSGVRVWNCMTAPAPDMSGADYKDIDSQSAGTHYIYNNTFLARGLTDFTGVIVNAAGNGTYVCKNNICDRGANPSGPDAEAYLLSGATTTGSTNNLSDDDSAPGSNALINQFPVYVDQTSGDLRLMYAGNSARDAGTDLSADGNIPFSDDILGTARPIGAAWDMGAHETAKPTVTAAKTFYNNFPKFLLRPEIPQGRVS